MKKSFAENYSFEVVAPKDRQITVQDAIKSAYNSLPENVRNANDAYAQITGNSMWDESNADYLAWAENELKTKGGFVVNRNLDYEQKAVVDSFAKGGFEGLKADIESGKISGAALGDAKKAQTDRNINLYTSENALGKDEFGNDIKPRDYSARYDEQSAERFALDRGDNRMFREVERMMNDAVLKDPFSDGKLPTRDEIIERMRLIKTVERDAKELEKIPVLGTLAARAMGGIGRVYHSLAGINRLATAPFESIIGNAPYKLLKEIGDTGIILSQRTNPDGSFLYEAGGLPFDLARLALLSRLPGGAVVGFGVDSGLQSLGRGENVGQVLKETTKGAALGGLFTISGGASKLVEKAALKPIARIGTITGGTYIVEKSFGATDEQALYSAITNAIFEVGQVYGSSILGKVVKVWNKGKAETVKVENDGAIVRYEGKENTPADIELVLDPTDGVYKQKSDFSERAKTQTAETPKAENQTVENTALAVRENTLPENNFVTERNVTLNAQKAAMENKANPSAVAVLYTDAQSVPEFNQNKFFPVETKDGVLLVNDNKLRNYFNRENLGVYSRGKAARMIGKGQINQNDLIGGKAFETSDTTPESFPNALVTTDKNGNELNASVVNSPETAQRQTELDKARFSGENQSAIVPTSEIIASRQENRPIDSQSKKLSSTKLNLEREQAAEISSFAKKLIAPEDIARNAPDYAKDGFGGNPHITLKHGIESNDVKNVESLFSGEKEITVTLGKTKVFSGKESGKPYDVVMIEVDSPDLHRLNKKVSDNTKTVETFSKFKPHLTLAYVEAGSGAKYANDATFEGQKIKFGAIEFSPAVGEKSAIKLGAGTGRGNEIAVRKNTLPRIQGKAGPKAQNIELTENQKTPFRASSNIENQSKQNSSWLPDSPHKTTMRELDPKRLTELDKARADSIVSEYDEISGKTPAELYDKAVIKFKDGNLYVNAEATELLRHADFVAFKDAESFAYFGRYLNPSNAARIEKALQFNFGAGRSRSSEIEAKKKAFLAEFAKARNSSKLGDVRQIVTSKIAKFGLRAARKEEASHSADFSVGDQHAISGTIFKADKIGRRAMHHVKTSGYENFSEEGIGREITGKLFTNTATSDLNLSADEVKHLRNYYFSKIKEAGKSFVDVEKAFRPVSKSARNYLQETRSNYEQSGTESGKTTDGRTRRNGLGTSGNSRKTDTGRTRNISERVSGVRAETGSSLAKLDRADQRFIERKTQSDSDLAEKVASEILYSKNSTADKKMTFGDYVIDITKGIPQALIANLDWSAPGRQAWILTLSNPVAAAKAFKQQAVSFFSASAHKKFADSIDNHPLINTMEDTGLYLANRADKSDLTQREERFMSRILGNDPFFKNENLDAFRQGLIFPVRWSERAYGDYLDKIRIESYMHLSRQVFEYNKRNGITDNSTYQKQLEGVSKFINFASGRGDLGRFEDNAAIIGLPFFSVRNWLSRFQILSPRFYATLPP